MPDDHEPPAAERAPADPPGADRADPPGADRAEPHQAEPDEGVPAGPRKVLIVLYGVFALAATARGIVQIATKFEQAPLAYLLSLASGIIYISATVGLVSSRPWSRPLAWAACGTELVGVLVIGAASIVDAEAFPRDTVWSQFGSGYGYFPLLLPVLGLLWLFNTREAEREVRSLSSAPRR